VIAIEVLQSDDKQVAPLAGGFHCSVISQGGSKDAKRERRGAALSQTQQRCSGS
jgi:hypothetical protein